MPSTDPPLCGGRHNLQGRVYQDSHGAGMEEASSSGFVQSAGYIFDLQVREVDFSFIISFIIKKMRNLMYSTLPLFFWGLLIGMHMC